MTSPYWGALGLLALQQTQCNDQHPSTPSRLNKRSPLHYFSCFHLSNAWVELLLGPHYPQSYISAWALHSAVGVSTPLPPWAVRVRTFSLSCAALNRQHIQLGTWFDQAKEHLNVHFVWAMQAFCYHLLMFFFSFFLDFFRSYLPSSLSLYFSF